MPEAAHLTQREELRESSRNATTDGACKCYIKVWITYLPRINCHYSVYRRWHFTSRIRESDKCWWNGQSFIQPWDCEKLNKRNSLLILKDDCVRDMGVPFFIRKSMLLTRSYYLSRLLLSQPYHSPLRTKSFTLSITKYVTRCSKSAFSCMHYERYCRFIFYTAGTVLLRI